MNKRTYSISNYLLRCLGVALSILSTLSAYGQDMKILEVKEHRTNWANLEGTIVKDTIYNADQKTTLLIISPTIKGLQLDAGSCKEIKRVEKETETWIYLQGGAKHLRLSHKDYNPTPEFVLPFTLQKARTYLLTLTFDRVNTIAFDPDKSQTLELSVSPSTAKVIIDGQRVQLQDGKYRAEYQLGIHKYLITEPNYHSLEGNIELKDEGNIKKESLHMKQAFGWLKINDKDLSDTQVTIDDSIHHSKLTPFAQLAILSGSHKLSIVKPLKAVWTQNIVVQDSLITSVSPAFVDDYANLSFSADKDATIYIDGEEKGKGAWRGDLGAGEHIVECRRMSHRTTSRKIVVVNGKNESFKLDNPTPIYTTLTVKTEPVGAVVVVDDIKIGTTPLINYNKLLIGSHTIKVEKKGFRNEVVSQVLTESEPFVWDLKLTDVVNMNITTQPTATFVEVAETNTGYTPYSEDVPVGIYHVTLSKHGYYTQMKEIRVDGNHTDFSYKMKRIFFRKSGAYFEAAGQVGGFTGYGGSVGVYINRINIEADYLQSLSESEEIWWNGTSESDGTPYYPPSVTYKSSYIGGKVGYGIKAAHWLLITPQIGGGVTKLTKKAEKTGEISGVNNTYVASATLGIRFQVPLTRWLGLSLTPEYKAKLSSGKYFDQIAELSSTVKSWGDGVNCKIGLNIYF